MDKKEIIRKAAIKVFARDGFHSTKIQSIAEAAGIAVGTIYLYFKNKDDILDYIFMVEYKKRLNFIESTNIKKESYLQQISDFLRFHIKEIKESPETAKVLIQESVDPSLHKLEWVNKTFRGVPDIFKELIEKAKENGEVRDIDADIIGPTIFLSARTLTYRLQLENRENDYDYALEQFISFIINGIKK